MADSFSISSNDLVEGAKLANAVIHEANDATKKKGVSAGLLCGVIVSLIVAVAKLLDENARNVGGEMGKLALDLIMAENVVKNGDGKVVFQCIECDERIPKFTRLRGRKFCGAECELKHDGTVTP